ncbi:esterase/lipase family protein [Streptomyces sp. NPDC018031]|uniref:esterase/lipase family protein n=1 Tax=Streptomyces sp. NPDC018031 TaxID=3365033 RepID=UPI003795A214
MASVAGLTAVVSLGAIGIMGDHASASGEPQGPRQDDFDSAMAYGIAHPTALPSGANDWSCRPDAAHPEPVILVHGTIENRYAAWAGLAPRLKEAGYCVYALNYGGLAGAPVQGTASMNTSARTLGAFVDKVTAETGAARVDLVGHSQGGLLARHYLKSLGGAGKAHRLVALSPPNHGTTFSGMTHLSNPVSDLLTGAACASCREQMAGSDFLQTLNGGGETHPDVRYTVIATTRDQVVTPYVSAFLAPAGNVTNHRLQDFCPFEDAGHNDLGYNATATRLVLNALDPERARRPVC